MSNNKLRQRVRAALAECESCCLDDEDDRQAVEDAVVESLATDSGLKVLQDVLKRMRWDDQGGYLDVGDDGKFAGNCGFITSALPQSTPEEIDALFELAGIVPDPIVSKGSCETCAHAYPDGEERGWSNPCVSCKRPQMSNYDVKPEWLTREPRKLSDASCQCPICVERKEKWTVGRNLHLKEKTGA